MIIPIILAGGYGKRLWPLSTNKKPKQFIKLNGEKSLFQHAVENALLINDSKVIIICNQEHYELIELEIKNFNRNCFHILIEPKACNSLAAMAIGALFANKKFKDAYLLSLPTDHYIEDIEIIKNEIEKLHFIKSQAINIFGITAKYAETEYGYIKKGVKSFYKANLYKVESFIEKPKLSLAEKYVASDNYLWNSGIIFSSCSALILEMKIHTSLTLKYAKLALKKSLPSQENITLLNGKEYDEMPDISIDYALLEKTSNIQVIEVKLNWRDLGSWNSIIEIYNDTNNKNYIYGNITAKECKNSYLYAEKCKIIALGIENCIFVETEEAILVASKDKLHEVRHIINKSSSVSKTKYQEEYEKPWGKYKILSEESNSKTKILIINPGHKISMQLHNKREEYWTVISGLGKLLLNESIIELIPGNQVHIPKSAKHRVENIGAIPLKIIEVQIGNYLEENDIIRFEDDYGRAEEVKLICNRL